MIQVQLHLATSKWHKPVPCPNYLAHYNVTSPHERNWIRWPTAQETLVFSAWTIPVSYQNSEYGKLHKITFYRNTWMPCKKWKEFEKIPSAYVFKARIVLYSMYGFIKQSSPKSRNKFEWIIYCIEIIKNRLLTNIEFCQLECKTSIHSITKWTVWSIMSFMLKTKIQYTVDTVTLCRSDSVMQIYPSTKHSIGRAAPKGGGNSQERTATRSRQETSNRAKTHFFLTLTPPFPPISNNWKQHLLRLGDRKAIIQLKEPARETNWQTGGRTDRHRRI